MNKSHFKTIFCMFIFSAAMPLFAADIVPQGLNNITNQVVAVFTSGLVRGILIACLAGCGVAYGFNKDNEKMKRNVIAIAIAIAIIVAAQAIVGAVFDAASS
jgi:hypothetical protein